MTTDHKRCSHCRESKPRASFAKDGHAADGLRCRCRQCCSATRRRTATEKASNVERLRKLRRERPDLKAEYSRRYYAKPEKAALAKAYKQKWERANRARTNATAQRWRDANRERLRTNVNKAAMKRILKRHGITQEQHDEMLRAQGGVCAICRKRSSAAKTRPRLSIDHCHSTNVVRGLLCHRCNVAIGLFGDDPELMRAAAGYVERSREVPAA